MLKPAFVVAMLAALLAACSVHRTPAGPTVHEHQVVELDTSELTRVHLKMGAGALDVKGGAAHLADADFTYNLAELKPTIGRTPGELTISQPTVAVMDKADNHWEIALNDAAPTELDVHVGAGEAKLKLGSLNLRKVNFNVGAGEVDLDLRGTPKTSYAVEVAGGVGSATIHLPGSVAISAMATGGIGSVDVTGLERDKGRWINPRVKEGAVTIDLNVHGGVGEIKLVVD